MLKKLLIIDDDTDLCHLLSRLLEKNGYGTQEAFSGKKGIECYKEQQHDAVICDYRLGDMDGIQLVRELKEIDPRVPILIITGYSDIKTAVEVIKSGASDYITKPLIPDEVIKIVTQLLATRTGEVKNQQKKPTDRLTKKETRKQHCKFYEGTSPSTRFLYEQASLVAETKYSVILYGESGTGKEVIAQTIHQLSPRADKPFVAMDCGTLSKELAGSELFGHVKGSFTGAVQDKIGHFEIAEGGTLFLDEIANLSLEVQASLLRVIQQRIYKKVGGNKEIETDVRIIVATNEDLKQASAQGRFREDLYHRLNEFSITLPRLQERSDDILPLAHYFLQQCCSEVNKVVEGFNNEVQDIFMAYNWPGNLRELRNVIRRAVLLAKPKTKITPLHLPQEILLTNTSPQEKELLPKAGPNYELLKDAVNRAEFEMINSVLQKVNFNKTKAAELLNIDRKTLYNKLKGFQIFDTPYYRENNYTISHDK